MFDNSFDVALANNINGHSITIYSLMTQCLIKISDDDNRGCYWNHHLGPNHR